MAYSAVIDPSPNMTRTKPYSRREISRNVTIPGSESVDDLTLADRLHKLGGDTTPGKPSVATPQNVAAVTQCVTPMHYKNGFL
ncbi:hypothetical protein J2D73_16505 [Acetobacter sacchari]|uniref:Uncharacterized protein n=1 Tax=Acetobacter sacchari TaxID=2661687 RepID=A0ABS3LZR5_9PROT|nr:hypothetical protein [Acetobacter sacchari]MBO1361388.1 hypothetical protein [Acetobacter sacchari]